MSVTNDIEKAVSEETLVNIPEATDTSGDAEYEETFITKKFTVEYRIVPTVPICAIISIALMVLGISLLQVAASHIDGNNFTLTLISAFLFALGVIFTLPCFVPIIYCLCMCFGIALF